MRAFTIERGRQAGRSTELMRNAAAFLRKNPQAYIAVITPYRVHHLVNYLVDQLGADNMTIKHVHFLTGTTLRTAVHGRMYDAVYFDDADYLALDAWLNISPCIIDVVEYGVVVETGKEALWVTESRERRLEELRRMQAEVTRNAVFIQSVLEVFENA